MNSQPPPILPISDITSSGWPRRASKACANCRRDKVRCDGARPCSVCTKKGYASDQCIDGCDPCRRARTRCENGRPCTRCNEMNLTCSDDLGSTATGGNDAGAVGIGAVAHTRHDGAPAGPSGRIVRSGAERAKLACANCRRDNKKCDDQRPCARCIARSEECIHVTRGPKLVKLRCEPCRKNNQRCDEGRPCRPCTEHQLDCVTQPRKGRGHGTRVKAACMSCRRDKIRCDGSRPCASCTRKGFECIERPCRTCSRDGRGTYCTHRKTSDGNDTDDENHTQPEPEIMIHTGGPPTTSTTYLQPTMIPSVSFAQPNQPMGQIFSIPPYYLPPNIHPAMTPQGPLPPQYNVNHILDAGYYRYPVIDPQLTDARAPGPGIQPSDQMVSSEVENASNV